MSRFDSALFADETEVRGVSKALEQFLRQGDAGEAAHRIDMAIDALATLGHPIAALCRAVPASAVQIEGWSDMAERIARLDCTGKKITGLGIDISSPGHIGVEPDEAGRLSPYIETNYYSDSAYPFSTAGRPTILAGYSSSNSEWQGSFEDIDNEVSVSGLELVYGAAYTLWSRIHAQQQDPELSPADHDAMFIALAFVSVRLHQAVLQCVVDRGLPGPMAVLVGSNEAYPYFDAPVITTPEYRQLNPDQEWPVIEPETQQEASADGTDGIAGESAIPISSGAELRRRLAAMAPSQAQEAASDAEEAANQPKGAFARLFRKRA